jgi:hypothetical protein
MPQTALASGGLFFAGPRNSAWLPRAAVRFPLIVFQTDAFVFPGVKAIKPPHIRFCGQINKDRERLVIQSLRAC